MSKPIVSEQIDSLLTLMPRLDAETQGRVFAIIAIATDRIKYLAKNGTGVSDRWKIARINEIIEEIETELGDVLK